MLGHQIFNESDDTTIMNKIPDTVLDHFSAKQEEACPYTFFR
jgi:hypothetical protein